jgi:hypothetical protein
LDQLSFISKIFGLTAPLGLAVALTACIVFVGRHEDIEFFTNLDPKIFQAVVIAGITGASIFVVEVGKSAISLGEKTLRAKRRQEKRRLTRIYRPIHILFLTRHIGETTSISAPYLRNRIRNAREAFFGTQYLRPAIRATVRALFDKRIRTTTEVEYGGDFPLRQILEIVRKNHTDADTQLMDLVRRADRAQYEDQQGGIMTAAELSLFDHIFRQHSRLSKKYT